MFSSKAKMYFLTTQHKKQYGKDESWLIYVWHLWIAHPQLGVRSWSESWPQIQEIQVNDCNKDNDINRWAWTSSAVIWVFWQTVAMMTAAWSQSSLYQSIYISVLLYSQELWVVTVRMNLQIPATKIGFIRLKGSLRGTLSQICQKKPVEVVWKSDKILFKSLPQRIL